MLRNRALALAGATLWEEGSPRHELPLQYGRLVRHQLVTVPPPILVIALPSTAAAARFSASEFPVGRRHAGLTIGLKTKTKRWCLLPRLTLQPIGMTALHGNGSLTRLSHCRRRS